ncbi:hypothetical protein [Sorangium cellulosum]|uniref:hypothetical protein n=1 Tax=Sorangium cellulosum TaxID=56 RepID=UPI0011DD3A8D|nr:hypothetical protein [Sorangium cellulosum]
MSTTTTTAIAAFPTIAATAAWLRPSSVFPASTAVPAHAAMLAVPAASTVPASARDDARPGHANSGVVRQNPDAGSAWTAALAGLAAAAASTAGAPRSAALLQPSTTKHGSAA